MPRLLSGSTLRRGGSGEFLDLRGAMPQLPATDTTLTGFTLVTNELLQTSYRSSLGFIEFNSATMHSSLPNGTIRILNSGSNTVSTGTMSGLLVVEGDVGIAGTANIWKDINVNGITIGRGYEFGLNNIVIQGDAVPLVDNFETGQQSIAIGYDTLKNIALTYKSLAIGNFALSSGTALSNNIAIGDSALKVLGVTTGTLNDSNVAVGVDAGKVLADGQQNVFIGYEAANLLTTGSYNIIIGPITGQYLYTGSGIISIGGDNIVDGLDNQVNIGSVFYYDGTGYSYISSDVNLGLGTHAQVTSTGTFTSTSTVTGGLVVAGGAFIWDNLVVANGIETLTTATSTFTGDLVVGGTITVQSTATSYIAGTFAPSTAFGRLGAVGNAFNQLHAADTYITGEFNVTGSENVDISPAGADVFIKPTAGGVVEIRPNAEGSIDNMVIGANDPADATFNNVYADTGIADEGNLLYTPKVTVQAGTPPTAPRIGDIWIEPGIPAYLQYIKDGTSTFWIQVGAV